MLVPAKARGQHSAELRAKIFARLRTSIFWPHHFIDHVWIWLTKIHPIPTHSAPAPALSDSEPLPHLLSELTRLDTLNWFESDIKHGTVRVSVCLVIDIDVNEEVYYSRFDLSLYAQICAPL